MASRWIDLCGVAELPEGGILSRGAVSVLRDGSGWHACASRCPHMGYPMRKATVRDGVITCAWHNWEFDLQHGGCYRGACDDLAIHPVEIRGDRVWVALGEEQRDEHEAVAALHDALLAADPFLQAKALSRLLAAGWSDARVVEEALRCDFRHSVATHQSLRAAEEAQAIADAGRLAARVDAGRRAQVLLQGLRQAGGPSGERQRVVALPGPHEVPGLLRRLDEYVRDPSRLGLERIGLSLRESGIEADTLWAALLQAVATPAFIDARQTFWAVVAARVAAAGLDDALAPEALAMAAWAAGTPRTQPDAECAPALRWWNANEARIAACRLAAGGDSDAAASSALATGLGAVLQGNSVERALDLVLGHAERGTSFVVLLDACQRLAARRMASLKPNNGGMWDAAVEGLQACSALRRAAALVPGVWQLPALLLTVFGFFRSRWLPAGEHLAWPSLRVGEDPATSYAAAFAAGDAARLRVAAVTLLQADGEEAWQAWLAPLVDEDLDPEHLELLALVVADEARGPDWEALVCGVATWIMDGRGRQTVRPAARFGTTMLSGEAIEP